jgi:pseudaminic acid synthase
MINQMKIGNRPIGLGAPVYIVAEMSANHGQSFRQAVTILEAAKKAGADAIKLQTYKPDTMTIDCNNAYFYIKGMPGEGRTLYDLYKEAYTPWDWLPKLKTIADRLELDLFSTSFDESAVCFLEQVGVPVHKIASFEIVDLPLLRQMAKTGKPIILSTGMATLSEIDEAVKTIREAGGDKLALLKCTTAYPALPDEMNLRTIPHLVESFGVPVGLSDHTLSPAVPIAAVALGACIIEKHLTLSRTAGGPDSSFSLEPEEFKTMAQAVRAAEKALGEIHYGVSKEEIKGRAFRRSLFVVKNIPKGRQFTKENVRSIRPGYGLPPRYLDWVLGRIARINIKSGTPLTWDLVS